MQDTRTVHGVRVVRANASRSVQDLRNQGYQLLIDERVGVEAEEAELHDFVCIVWLRNEGRRLEPSACLEAVEHCDERPKVYNIAAF